MKLHLIYADTAGNIDGVTKSQLLDHLPLTPTLSQADAVVVMCMPNVKFRFNHKLNEVVGKKPIIIIDYMERGWDWNFAQENVLGRGVGAPHHWKNDDYGTLDQWVAKADPVLQFVRELRRKDLSSRVIPIDFMAYLPRVKTSSEAEFNARLLDVVNIWGYSNPERPRVHGDIFHGMGTMGLSVISDFRQVPSPHVPKKSWFTCYTPHWARATKEEVARIHAMGKISLSLPGAGRKCFREQEAPNDAVLALQSDDIVRAYEWMNGINCIKLNRGREIVELVAAAERTDLYSVYLNCQENLENYRIANYVPRYVLKNIQERL